jgi:hypothetical protein
MSGIAARTRGALGAHDRLSVRAIVLKDTALNVCDVIGLHENMSARLRRRACLPNGNIVSEGRLMQLGTPYDSIPIQPQSS